MRDLEFDIRGRDRTAAAFDAARANARAFNGDLDRTARGFNLATTAARAFAAAFTVTAIAGFGRVIKETIADAGDLVDLADKVGVSTGDLQSMTFGFSQAGVAAENIDQILTQWSKRIGEAHTQGGRLADIFKANGISLTDSEGRLRSSVDLMREYADLMQNAASDQERAAMSAEAFGRGGSEVVLALKDGAAGMNRLMALTEETGGVIEDELLRRAEDLGDRFEAVSQTIETYLRGAILRAASDMETLLGKVMAFDPSAASDVALDDRMASIGGERLEIENQILRLRGEQSEIAGFTAAAERRGLDAQIAALKERDALLQKQEQGIIGAFNGRAQGDMLAGDDAAFNRSFAAGRRPTIIPGGDDDDAPGRTASASAARDQERAYERVIAKLEEERAMLGLNATEQRILSEQRRAGVAAASEQGQAIAAVVRHIEAESARMAQLEEQQRKMNDAVRFFGSTALDSLLAWAEGAASAEDAARGLALEIARAVAYGALLGEGPLGGLLGGQGGGGLLGMLFGGLSGGGGFSVGGGGFTDLIYGARAHGGPVDPWGTYLVGERGPELLRMGSRGGNVVSNGDAFGGGMSTVRLIMPEGWRSEIVSEARSGAQKDAVRIVSEYDRTALPSRVHQINADPWAR